MAKKILVLEIGDQLTKVCVTVKKGKATHIQSSFYFDTPTAAVSDGQVLSISSMGQTLMAQLRENGVTGVKNVMFVLSSSKIISREAVLPPVKDRQLTAIVRANAADYFPLDLSHYEISHSILGANNEEGQSGNRVLITVAPRLLLQSYLDLAKELGMNVNAFDYIINSQFQLYSKVPCRGITMFVSIGARQTYTSFVRQGAQLLQRTVPFGGDDIISTVLNVAGEGNASFSKGLSFCQDRRWISENLSPEQYNEATYRVVNGVVRSAEFFKSTYQGVSIDRVIVVDYCSDIAGLTQSISSAMGVSAVRLESLPGVAKVASGSNISFFASSVGATIEPLGLVPADAKQKGVRKSSESRAPGMMIPIFVCVLCIVVGVAITASAVLNFYTTSSEIEAMGARINELAPAEQVYNTYVEYSAMEENVKILEGHGINNNAALRAFLEELEQKMPSDLLLLSASCDDFGVAMNVEVGSMEDSAVVLSQLRTFSSIDEIRVSAIAESVNDLGEPIVAFSITCSYYLPEVEEETPPTEEALPEDDEITQLEDELA